MTDFVNSEILWLKIVSIIYLLNEYLPGENV